MSRSLTQMSSVAIRRLPRPVFSRPYKIPHGGFKLSRLSAALRRFRLRRWFASGGRTSNNRLCLKAANVDRIRNEIERPFRSPIAADILCCDAGKAREMPHRSLARRLFDALSRQLTRRNAPQRRWLGIVTVTGGVQRGSEVRPRFMRRQPHLATGRLLRL